MRTFLFSWLLLLLAVPSMADDVPAFPGAEGHGRFVTGGRGGEIRHVTTLLDDGNNNTKGTLRWAVNGSAKKTVVFDEGTLMPASASNAIVSSKRRPLLCTAILSISFLFYLK